MSSELSIFFVAMYDTKRFDHVKVLHIVVLRFIVLVMLHSWYFGIHE